MRTHEPELALRPPPVRRGSASAPRLWRDALHARRPAPGNVSCEVAKRCVERGPIWHGLASWCYDLWCENEERDAEIRARAWAGKAFPQARNAVEFSGGGMILCCQMWLRG